MTPLCQDAAYIAEFDAWVTCGERVELLELVTRELVRTQSLTTARLSLLRLLEQDASGRWHPMGSRWSVDELGRALARLVLAEDETASREPSAHRQGLMCRPRGTRTRLLGVPHATLESWIRNELRPAGFLKPSTGPGRPRRDTPKYELGAYFDR